jgi:hypothetical protein
MVQPVDVSQPLSPAPQYLLNGVMKQTIIMTGMEAMHMFHKCRPVI